MKGLESGVRVKFFSSQALGLGFRFSSRGAGWTLGLWGSGSTV